MLRQAVGRVLAVDHTIEVDDLCAIAISDERINIGLGEGKRRHPELAEPAVKSREKWRLPPGISDWMTLVEAYVEVGEAFTRAADAFTAVEWRWGEPTPAGWDEAADAMRAAASACRRRLDEIMPRPA